MHRCSTRTDLPGAGPLKTPATGLPSTMARSNARPRSLWRGTFKPGTCLSSCPVATCGLLSPVPGCAPTPSHPVPAPRVLLCVPHAFPSQSFAAFQEMSPNAAGVCRTENEPRGRKLHYRKQREFFHLLAV